MYPIFFPKYLSLFYFHLNIIQEFSLLSSFLARQQQGSSRIVALWQIALPCLPQKK